jgi:hypothetical protein
MICNRCGKEFSDCAAICPACGTVAPNRKSSGQPVTNYGQFPASVYDIAPPPIDYGQSPMQQYYTQMPPAPPNTSYGQMYNAPPMNQHAPFYSASVPGNPAAKNNGALVAEILLSLIGIYGVGWLIAGETLIGVILLVCSFVVFAPLAILIAIFTFGIGIFAFDLPLAIGGIILNAILLNRVLDRQAAQAQNTMHQHKLTR